MGTDQIMYCIVALILGMLIANMLKNVCGCKNVVEGKGGGRRGAPKTGPKDAPRHHPAGKQRRKGR